MLDHYDTSGSHGLAYVERYDRTIQGYDSRKDVKLN